MNNKTRDTISKLVLDDGFYNKQALEDVEWRIDETLIDYEYALKFMEERVAAIRQGEAKELIWLLQHPPLYTAGTSADDKDLLIKDKFPVYKTGRGGEFTYHGPGQRVIYVMLDLTKRKQDLRLFISALEEWIIRTLKCFGIVGERREDRVGVWVQTGNLDTKQQFLYSESKIAAIGIRIRRWVSFHGIALNINPDLSHYNGIVACGLSDYGITSFAQLNKTTDFKVIDKALQSSFAEIFTKPLDSNI